jgi:hypothetical protein
MQGDPKFQRLYLPLPLVMLRLDANQRRSQSLGLIL